MFAVIDFLFNGMAFVGFVLFIIGMLVVIHIGKAITGFFSNLLDALKPMEGNSND